MNRTRLLVVEDHPIFLKGLVSLLRAEPDLEVVAEATNRHQAVEAASQHGPDMAIVDLSLGDESGLDVIKDILYRAPMTRILVLSMHDDPIYRRRAEAAGALGFCQKGEDVELLLDAVRTVAKGRRWQSPRLAAQENQDTGAAEAALQTLTDREFEVLGMVGRGMGTGEIASKLNISVKTVDTYKGNLKAKLGCPTAQDLRRFAVLWQSRESRL